jgi:hypothetical protein
MNRRTFGMLALIAAVFAVLAIVGQNRTRSGSIAGDSVGTLLLPALGDELDSVRQIVVRGAGAEALASLDRTDGGWVVSEQDDYPAAVTPTNALLIALAEARIVEEKTTNPEFYSRLGVEDVAGTDARGLEVTLLTAAGGRYQVILGDSYGSGERYARIEGQAQSVLIDRDPNIARSAADWVDKTILAAPGGGVQRVEIMHADGERLVIEKATPSDSSFTVDAVPAGRELQYPGVADVTGNVLQNLQLEAVARQPEPATEPIVTTEFRTFDGLFVTASATAADDGDPWLSFSARFDAEQALAFAEEPGGDLTDEVSATGVAATDAIAEAEAINTRLAGWRFRIPAYQYSQMTRRMEDLLRAPPVTE